MRNIKNYLNNNNIKFEDKNTGGYSPYVKFMVDNKIYLVTDYNNQYVLETINKELYFKTKTQKNIIERINEL